ncbi:hypothetical protein [Streptomyces sp. 6-11-2]|uniref:hypothetical protein n=1 Tax=Streptomyces sp. 6-11-2 TaxID=2585753 RepID=UPI00155B1443|nr:hypothetical protein [Streptomyces sp. 6-11-2]
MNPPKIEPDTRKFQANDLNFCSNKPKSAEGERNAAAQPTIWRHITDVLALKPVNPRRPPVLVEPMDHIADRVLVGLHELGDHWDAIAAAEATKHASDTSGYPQTR